MGFYSRTQGVRCLVRLLDNKDAVTAGWQTAPKDRRVRLDNDDDVKTESTAPTSSNNVAQNAKQSPNAPAQAPSPVQQRSSSPPSNRPPSRKRSWWQRLFSTNPSQPNPTAAIITATQPNEHKTQERKVQPATPTKPLLQVPEQVQLTGWTWPGKRSTT